MSLSRPGGGEVVVDPGRIQLPFGTIDISPDWRGPQMSGAANGVPVGDGLGEALSVARTDRLW